MADLSDRLIEAGRQLSTLAPQEFGAALAGKGIERGFPGAADRFAARACRSPFCTNVLRDHEGRIAPPEPLARAGDLGGAERRAMRRRCSGLGWRPKGNRRAAGNKVRTVAVLRPPDSLGDGRLIVAVDPFGRPAVAPESQQRIVGECQLRRAVDRNRIVVVEHD